jgi:hypothetical protein
LCDTYTHGHADHYPDQDFHRYRDSDSHADCNTNENLHADGHSDADNNVDPDRYCDPHSDG